MQQVISASEYVCRRLWKLTNTAADLECDLLNFMTWLKWLTSHLKYVNKSICLYFNQRLPIIISFYFSIAWSYSLFNEVYVSGQNQDVWCYSRRVITDNRMYNDAGPNKYYGFRSCYKIFQGMKMIVDNLGCRPTDAFSYHAGFICAPVDQQ
jgi:hypothetical protein